MFCAIIVKEKFMKKEIVDKCVDVLEVAGKTALSVIPVGGALATALYDVLKEMFYKKDKISGKE